MPGDGGSVTSGAACSHSILRISIEILRKRAINQGAKNAIEVERLDPKPLNVRATGPKRVEVKSLHLPVASSLPVSLTID
jgi:hypothetical protein